MKPKPSNKPTHVNGDLWYYEYRGRIDIVHDGTIIPIPWKQLMESARRCRPEEFTNEKQTKTKGNK